MIFIRQIEAEHQKALFQWAKLMEKVVPELWGLFHIPNGGRRDKAEAAKLKAEGVKPGVPDVFLPIARGGYHGLWIELKTIDGRPSKDQREWIEFLQAQGYRAVICYGWQAAQVEIENYIKLPKEDTNGKL